MEHSFALRGAPARKQPRVGSVEGAPLQPAAALPELPPRSRDINAEPAEPAQTRAPPPRLGLEGLAYAPAADPAGVVAGRHVGLASPPPSPEFERAATPLAHFEPGAARGALGPDPSASPPRRPVALVSEGRRPRRKAPDAPRPESPLPAKEDLIRSFAHAFERPDRRETGQGSRIARPAAAPAFPSGRVGAELPPLEGPKTRDRAALKLGRYLLAPPADPKPWRAASAVALGSGSNSLPSRLAVHEEAARLRAEWHAAGETDDAPPASLQADLSARQAIRPPDRAARFFLDRWLKSFDARADEERTVALSTKLLARFSAAAAQHTLTQAPSDEGRPPPSRDIVAVACATFDDLCDALGEALPALAELRRCVFEAMFLDEPRPVAARRSHRLLRWADGADAAPAAYAERRLWCEGGGLGEVKRAREELQRTARALRDAERGREAAQDELNQAEAQLAFREVVKRQDDAALAARRRAHGAADVAANALRSLLVDAEEAHAKTKAQVHEKISNMKALIHGNCDRERRKWKICRMLMLAAMKGLEEKYVASYEAKEEARGRAAAAERRLEENEARVQAREAAFQQERAALEARLNDATFAREHERKRAEDLHEENLTLRARASGGLGEESRGVLEQLSDREREAAQLKNELRERDALLAETEARAAQSDARVAELEGVLAEKEEAAAAAARRIVELEADTAAKTEDIGALEARRAALDAELAAYREEAAQRLVDGGTAQEQALRRALAEAERTVDERRAHAAYVECVAARQDAATAAGVADAAADIAGARDAIIQSLADARAAFETQRDDACEAAAAAAEARGGVESARREREGASRAADADAALAKVQTELAGRDATVERLTEELGDARARVAALEAELGDASARCARLEAERDAAAAEARAALGASAEEAEALREAARLRDEEAARRLAAAEAAREEEREATRRAEAEAKQRERDALRMAEDEAEAAMAGEAEVEALRGTLAALRSELAEAHLEIDKLQKLVAIAEEAEEPAEPEEGVAALASAFGFAEGEDDADEAADRVEEIRPATA